jgi:cytidylate kinase
MTDTIRNSHHLPEAAERQMRTWALGLQSQQRLAERRAAEPLERLVHHYLFLSRQSGVGAAELAEGVSRKCGWNVLGRDLLDQLAERNDWSPIALQYVDERTASWFHETLGRWLDQKLVSQSEYVRRLGKAVILAAQHESMIFIGRGLQFLLPREAGLTVRLIAPRKDRVARIRRQRGLSERGAERYIDDADKGRADFVRRYFHHDVDDPSLYDLTINLERLSRDAAVDVMASAILLRWPAGTPA